MAIYLNGCISSKMTVTTMIMIIRMNTHRRVVSHQTCAHNEHKLKPCIYALCPDDGLICRTHVRTYTIVRMALNSIDDLKDGRMSPPPLRASSDNFVCVSFIGRQLNLDCSTIAKRVHHALHARLALLDGLNVCLPLLHVLSKANARNKVRTFQRVSPGQIIRSDHADDKGRLLC